MNTPWIFWINHLLKNVSSKRGYECFTLCRINHHHIMIEGYPPILISDIESVEFGLMTRYHTITVNLNMKDKSIIRIGVADPYYPNFRNRNNAKQAFAFKELVEQLIMGQHPAIEKNPYLRTKKKANFYPPGMEYEPNISPQYYYDKFRPAILLNKLVIQLVGTLILIILIVIIIGVVADGLL